MEKSFRQHSWGSNPGLLVMHTSALITELSHCSHNCTEQSTPRRLPMSALHCWVTSLVWECIRSLCLCDSHCFWFTNLFMHFFVAGHRLRCLLFLLLKESRQSVLKMSLLVSSSGTVLKPSCSVCFLCYHLC